MAIAAQTPRKDATARKRRLDDRGAGKLTLVEPTPVATPREDPADVLRDMIAAAEVAAAETRREVWRREAERRRAAAALEADLYPMRVDEAERARRRAAYGQADLAVSRARAELARAGAVADAARLLADTLAARGAGAAERAVSVSAGS